MALTTITLENLNNFQVDDGNRLYWMGEGIVTMTMIDLPTWVDTAVGFGAWAAVVVAIIMLLNYLDLKPSWPWAKGAEIK